LIFVGLGGNHESIRLRSGQATRIYTDSVGLVFLADSILKASPFDPFDYAQGRLRSGQALS